MNKQIDGQKVAKWAYLISWLLLVGFIVIAQGIHSYDKNGNDWASVTKLILLAVAVPSYLVSSLFFGLSRFTSRFGDIMAMVSIVTSVLISGIVGFLIIGNI